MPVKQSNVRQCLRELAGDGTILLLLLVAGWVYTFGMEQLVDIALYDETNYLRNGLELPFAGLPPADGYPRGAPLYAVWYWFLSLLRKDPVQLYYLNCKATVFMPSLACFLLMRGCRVGRVASVLVSLIILFLVANLDVWPRNSHFTLTIILCGLALASFVKPPETKISVGVLTALLASYVRPEFFLGFLCLLILLAGLICWRLLHQKVKPPLVPLVATVVVCGLLLVGVGVPLGSAERSWLAFQQHYAVNASRWLSSDISPWTNHRYFVEPDFPHARTILGALCDNPGAFGKHVFSNLTSFPLAAKDLFSAPYRASTLPLATSTSVLLALAVLCFLSLPPRRFFQMLKRTWESAKKSLLSICTVLLLLGPPVLSAVIIHPRPHYLFFLILLPIHIMTILCQSSHINRRGTLAAMAIVFVFILFISRPTDKGQPQQPNLAVISTLRSLAIQRPVNLLEAEGGYGVYVGTNYRYVPEYTKHTDFNTFLRDNAINMIVVSEGMKKDPRFQHDPQWQTFIADPPSSGFQAIAVAGVPGRLVLVEGALLQTGSLGKEKR